MIWVLVVLAVYLLLLFAIALASLHPFRTPLFISPGLLGTPQEELVIPSTGAVALQSWWIDAPESEVVAILCHGYVMNRSELSPVAHWLWQRGVSSLIIDFRAHGKTRGGAATVGWKEADDVAAAVLEARKRRPAAKIILIGSSMGSAACAFAASRGVDADAIVLDSCYSRLIGASFGWWRFIGGPNLSFLLGPTVFIAGPLAGVNPFKVDVARALERVDCPVLVLHGREDNLATPAEAERNLAALGPGGEIVWFEGCGHSEFRWLQAERYYRELEAFLIRQGLIDSPNARMDALGN